MSKLHIFSHKIKKILLDGGVGVMPTDTIYGVVGSALNKKAVERIYKLRKRNPKKPLIILIGDMKPETWNTFGIVPKPQEKKLLEKYWPRLRQGYGGQAGKVSIILPIRNSRVAFRLRYLHRGTNTLAFRLPAKKSLREFLKKTGPLVAPSANIEGNQPAKTIAEAKKYFGGRADFYVDGGRLNSKPSKLIKIENGKIEVLRK